MTAKPEGTKNKTQWLTTANGSIIKKPNVTELLATGKVVPLRKLSAILMNKSCNHQKTMKHIKTQTEEIKETDQDKQEIKRVMAYVPIILDFTGDVRIADDGKALTIDVLKTNKLAMATKDVLHITIAYHENQVFPEHIVKAATCWMGNLHIHQKTLPSEDGEATQT